jgi:hypothetical protein
MEERRRGLIQGVPCHLPGEINVSHENAENSRSQGQHFNPGPPRN